MGIVGFHQSIIDIVVLALQKHEISSIISVRNLHMDKRYLCTIYPPVRSFMVYLTPPKQILFEKLSPKLGACK